ncbi:MAG: polysaccharide deacetylase family protein [Euryarchaeota archaeon]|nr:polysaccharide deacetylase family protein [Euryarchaeota archaeon]
MTDIVLVFEVHQPFRLRPGRPPGFDHDTNRAIFERVARKCYEPTTRLLLDLVKEHRGFRVAFSLSGTWMEQAEEYRPDLLDLFRSLARSRGAEFLAQTYYHSLSSLFADPGEFREQVEMHRHAVRERLGVEPRVFENTELLYNDRIAGLAEEMGFRAIFAEGVERVLGWRSPTYVYRPPGRRIATLLRHYRLTDDVGFRFSSRSWEEWPLTADKYASWLSQAPGPVVVLFMDYETFGEHHWPETGIRDFLRWLPGEVLKHGHLGFATPSEAVERNPPAGEVSVDPMATTSWADLSRDTSCWLGNDFQRICFQRLEGLGERMAGYRGADREDLLRRWRMLQTSDHLHHLYTEGGGPGEVHAYFRPFSTALEGFLTYYDALADLESRLRVPPGSKKPGDLGEAQGSPRPPARSPASRPPRPKGSPPARFRG